MMWKSAFSASMLLLAAGTLHPCDAQVPDALPVDLTLQQSVQRPPFHWRHRYDSAPRPGPVLFVVDGLIRPDLLGARGTELFARVPRDTIRTLETLDGEEAERRYGSAARYGAVVITTTEGMAESADGESPGRR
jgi:hypothetical protein